MEYLDDCWDFSTIVTYEQQATLYFSDFIVFWCFGQLNNSVLDIEYISTSFQGKRLLIRWFTKHEWWKIITQSNNYITTKVKVKRVKVELLTTTFQINRDSDDWCGKDYWIIQFISSFLSPPLPLDPSLSKPELPPKPREKQLSLAPLSCPLTSTLRWGHRRSSQQVELSVSEPPEQGHLRPV